MLLKTYTSLYQKKDHKAKDALPKPTVAQTLSVELSKVHQPTGGQIRMQTLLADRYGLSIESLLRFEKLMLDHSSFKYLPIVERFNKRPTQKLKQHQR
ncbi:hypothetical protein [Leuconostoc citreum]|uniref:hypothetical protein n=1 Tax=Leuconostoc citreum TaxID=33964 RepID=UPI0032DEC888